MLRAGDRAAIDDAGARPTRRRIAEDCRDQFSSEYLAILRAKITHKPLHVRISGTFESLKFGFELCGGAGAQPGDIDFDPENG
jgi:hypothetical protein